MEVNGRNRRKLQRLSIDRLSELPDAILCHILSFLPTKTSVATSILAKRWRFVWAYVPNLHFECKNQGIIHRVLLLHKLPSLKSLTIKVENCVKSQIETWIRTAIDRNVECLHLYVEYHKPLPFRLFTCETLVDLRLCECGKIPTLHGVCLPRLKKLYLKNVDFEDDESLPCLLSGSPVLECLKIQSNIDLLLSCLFTCETLVDLRLCECVEIPTLEHVCLPRLKKLYLQNVYFEDDQSLPCLLSGCPVLEHFRIRVNDETHMNSCYISSPTIKWLSVTNLINYIGHRLEINVPAVEHLTLHDSLSGPIECGDLTSLVTADIRHDYDDPDVEETLCSVSMLRFVDGLCSVKCLILDISSTAMIPDCLLSLWHPSFNNLTQLKLAADSRFLSKFLENAINLEICEFRNRERPTGWSWTKEQLELQSKGWIEPKQVPKCLLSCLRTIKVVDTVDTEEGLEIVRYLLRNANVLKRMEIDLGIIDSEEKKNLLQRISLFERGSKACELAFTEPVSNWEWVD